MLSKYTALLILFLYAFWTCQADGLMSCLRTIDKLVETEDGVSYWSNEIEEEFARNYERVSDVFRIDFDNVFLKDLVVGCGRMKNRLGLLSDGSRVCLRYRTNSEQIQGELYSYHLAKLLKIRNVLESKLVFINESNDFWRRINITDNSWYDRKLIIATKFMKYTSPVRLPQVLLERNFKVDLNISLCGNDNENDMGLILSLFQWSDMVIFDYLIGNFDRVVSNMFNLQWHSTSLMDPIDNLVQLEQGLWLFVDNEEGFSHGYRLLDRYEKFHFKLLKNMCIFRRETLQRLNFLSKLSAQELHRQIWYSISESYKKSHILDFFTKISQHNINILKGRIDLVLSFFNGCREKRVQ